MCSPIRPPSELLNLGVTLGTFPFTDTTPKIKIQYNLQFFPPTHPPNYKFNTISIIPNLEPGHVGESSIKQLKKTNSSKLMIENTIFLFICIL
jgi:hypothetical protein